MGFADLSAKSEYRVPSMEYRGNSCEEARRPRGSVEQKEAGLVDPLISWPVGQRCIQKRTAWRAALRAEWRTELKKQPIPKPMAGKDTIGWPVDKRCNR
jgi:hypothetical protein